MKNYIEIHGHNRCKVKSIEWYFHNYEHGYKHCKGGKKNPYEIKHSGRSGHIINKLYARGHGIRYKPQWFKFTKKSKISGWWLLSSGIEISIEDIPERFK